MFGHFFFLITGETKSKCFRIISLLKNKNKKKLTHESLKFDREFFQKYDQHDMRATKRTPS